MEEDEGLEGAAVGKRLVGGVQERAECGVSAQERAESAMMKGVRKVWKVWKVSCDGKDWLEGKQASSYQNYHQVGASSSSVAVASSSHLVVIVAVVASSSFGVDIIAVG